MEKREFLERCGEIRSDWDRLTRIDGLRRMSLGFGREKNHLELFHDSFWRIAEPEKVREVKTKIMGITYREFTEDHKDMVLLTMNPRHGSQTVLDKRDLLPKLLSLNEKTKALKDAGKINGILGGQRFQMLPDEFFQYFPKSDYQEDYHILAIDPKVRHYTLSVDGLDFTTFEF